MQPIRKVLMSAMEFTDEEKAWLLSISAEVPEGKLTLKDECLRDLAKPKDATEAQLFQILASIRFRMMEPNISDLESTVSSSQEKEAMCYTIEANQ